MLVQYIYIHACGHIATGPVLTTDVAHSPSADPNPSLYQIDLAFTCPFCDPLFDSEDCAQGQGLICVLADSCWVALWPLRLGEITPEDWAASFVTLPTGETLFQHMAWITRPVGGVVREVVVYEDEEVDDDLEDYVIGGMSEIGRNGVAVTTHVITRVGSAWREEETEEVEAIFVAEGTMANSRMGGLLSQLNAARMYDDMAEL